MDNDFQDNSASWAGSEGFGGGLYIEGGNVLLQGNSLTGNAGGGFPGAPSTAVGWGGAIAISDSLVIAQDNWIVGNHATNADASGAGGGIYSFGGTLRLVRNAIMQNRATPVALGFGGGLYLDSTIPWLDANIILDNVAAGGANGRGGGVRLVACSPFTLTNNVIAHNIASQYGSGVAVAASSAGHLAHNTIAYNQDGDGVGVYVASDSQVLLDNNLIVRHTIGIVNAGAPGSSVVADYTLFEDNTTNYGAGVVSSHEVAGPAALLADYHLGSSSGAIDHAPPLSWVTWDWDGDWRPVGAWSDVGADEYALHTVLPLVLRNAP